MPEAIFENWIDSNLPILFIKSLSFVSDRKLSIIVLASTSELIVESKSLTQTDSFTVIVPACLQILSRK